MTDDVIEAAPATADPVAARPFRRIAILDRGEAALRLVHAVRELNLQHDADLVTIAIHSDADARSLFVREADEAFVLSPRDGALERALRESGAEAAWVGWGPLAGDPDGAETCRRAGVAYIGPQPHVMRRLADGIGVRLLAEQAGAPVGPWSRGPVGSMDDAWRHAGVVGFPLVLRASADRTGESVRVVESADDLPAAVDVARREAQRAFIDPTVFAERLPGPARRLGVQIVADHHGRVWSLGVRDVSVRHRAPGGAGRTMLAASAPAGLDSAQARALEDASSTLARAAGYTGAATVEFWWEPETQRASFVGVVPYLDADHVVAELATGVDLVKLQLFVAAGGRLSLDPPRPSGHALVARITAEDPDRSFAPAAGTVELLSLPTGPGVRVDAGVAEHDVIPAGGGVTTIATIGVVGIDRNDARSRLQRALVGTTAVVAGGTTTKSFALQVVGHPDVVADRVDTGWLDAAIASGSVAGHGDRPEVALVAAAMEAHDADAALERIRFYAAAARGRPASSEGVGSPIDLRWGGRRQRLVVFRTGPHAYAVVADGHRIEVEVERLRGAERRLTIAGERLRTIALADGTDYLVEVDGHGYRVGHEDAAFVRAPGPGLVVAVPVQPGDDVEAGAVIATIESMKIESPIVAPYDGRVVEILVTKNVQVDAGAPLVRLDGRPHDAADGGGVVDFGRLAPAGAPGRSSPDDTVRDLLHSIRCLILGFDVAGSAVKGLVADYERARAQISDDDLAIAEDELDILRAFADLCRLSRNRRAGDDDDPDDPEPRLPGGSGRSAREYFHSYLRSLDVDAEGLPETFRDKLRRALRHYGVTSLDRTPELEESLHRVFLAQQRAAAQVPAVVALLDRRLERPEVAPALADDLRGVLDQMIVATELRHPVVGELARLVRFRCFDEPLLAKIRRDQQAEARADLKQLVQSASDLPGGAGGAGERAAAVERLVACPHPIVTLFAEAGPEIRRAMVEVISRRYYRVRALRDPRLERIAGVDVFTGRFDDEGGTVDLFAVASTMAELARSVATVAGAIDRSIGIDPTGRVLEWTSAVIDLYLIGPEVPTEPEALTAAVGGAFELAGLPAGLARVTVSAIEGATVQHLTFTVEHGEVREQRHLRGLHPMIAERLQLWRLRNFDIARVPASAEVHLFHCRAREVPTDERFIAVAEVRDLTAVRDAEGIVTALPELERILGACLDSLRQAQNALPANRRPGWNRVVLYVWPVLDVPVDDLRTVIRAAAPMTEGLGLEQLMVQLRMTTGEGVREVVVRMSRPPGAGLTIRVTDPPTQPLQPIDDYGQKVLRARRRGTTYPYEIVPLLTGASPLGGPEPSAPLPAGRFVEHDLDESGALVPVDRPYGRNTATIVVGVVTTPTERYPEGMTRVALLSDPTKGLGALAVPECQRVSAAIDLAERLQVPIEWFAVSSGAKIAMDSGTENMDGIAHVLRRIIEFTQDGGEMNIVVTGINVGGQPYWNAEATMLMHTRGILVMTPDSAMVLTGKQALDYSGGVSADDNFGIGGYERVMGPNGQAQYWAKDLHGACEVLFAHYEHTYVAPGERFPRRARTTDPADRDVRRAPYRDGAGPSEFRAVGDIFSDVTNPGRRQPFDIRTVLNAAADQDHPTLERWVDMQDAGNAVILDAHIGGYPVCLLGIESRPLPRYGLLPADGPAAWTGGTLFPHSSRKIARAVNAASGNRPLVVLANLSGFDGSPESLRKLQLEYGAEIGRAVVNFDGPIVFCVVSRYHGGAFVVFSRTLNDDMIVAAVEGSHASVIGGAPAAAVVFAGEVNKRTEADPRVTDLLARIGAAEGAEAGRLRAELVALRAAVRSEKLGDVATEFDQVHSVERALRTGSIDTIISADQLRPFLVDAVEKGIRRTLDRASSPAGST